MSGANCSGLAGSKMRPYVQAGPFENTGIFSAMLASQAINPSTMEEALIERKADTLETLQQTAADLTSAHSGVRNYVKGNLAR